MEWLGAIDEEDIPPDDDFFATRLSGTERSDARLRGRLFLVLANQLALQQLLRLWDTWKAGGSLPHGAGPFTNVFAQLRDIRIWGVRDRLEETGVLLDWSHRVAAGQQVVPFEVELWYRNVPADRRAASDRVARLISDLGGSVVSEATVDPIAYHAMLARLPIAAIENLVTQGGQDVALAQCEQIQFFRASGQMAGIISIEDQGQEPATCEPAPDDLGEPIIALLDGLPLQLHQRLADRLVVDDPDDYAENYAAAERQHGTAMASLLVWGDLGQQGAPLNRKVYVRPILRPDERAWQSPRPECVSEGLLAVDLIHGAVRRFFEPEGGEPAVAPSVCIINLSIGIRDRPFSGLLSPLARLLDWLAWRYKVLFFVSAGNYTHDVELPVSNNVAELMPADDLQTQLVKAVAADARNRRLLSPAEATNVVTVGSVHADASNALHEPSSFVVEPFISANLPSIVNAQGMGYRRAIKPDVLARGGRVGIRRRIAQGSNAVYEVVAGASRRPGQLVASPGPPGASNYASYTRGTSNATAIAARTAAQAYDTVIGLRSDAGGEIIDSVPPAIWLKALLVHTASWGDAYDVLDDVLRTPQNSRRFKEYLTRLVGYGAIDAGRMSECTSHRVTALAGGELIEDEAHIYRFPLPPSLSGIKCLRRLILTLAWLSPINPRHQVWRRANLWFSPPNAELAVDRKEADWQSVQRGTLQHEILTGKKATAFADGDALEIQVNCRGDAGPVADRVPYALAVTLEVAEDIEIDIYDEIRVRVNATRVQVTP
jgi:hypothetical protein